VDFGLLTTISGNQDFSGHHKEDMQLRIPFIPKEEKFYELFEDSAQNTVKAAKVLNELVDKWEHIEQRVEEIKELEHIGDTITHEIMARLHRTFVTPFDREDIALLAKSLDDIIDFIESASNDMLIYKVESPGRRVKELADVIIEATCEVERAVLDLRHKAKLKQILERCVEINRLENMADVVYRSALAELFEDSTDMAHVIKWREIYEHMESATDRCEDVANVIEGVALKHA
jgi:predicted phosphate transport protein (TIGR00153 family)